MASPRLVSVFDGVHGGGRQWHGGVQLVGGDWASFVFDKSYELIGAKEFAAVERKLLATGHRFDEELGVFEDPIKAIVEDVGRLRLDAHLAHRDKIRGFIYDLAANTVTEVTG